MRSILQVAVFDEKLWNKIPSVKADGIMLDLEDSVTPNIKVETRHRIVEVLENPGYFGGRKVIVRVNKLNTPWGQEDLAALARIEGDFVICYPKAETPEEVRWVLSLMNPNQVEVGLYLIVERARALIELDRMAGCAGVIGLHFGYENYASDVGARAFNESGDDLYQPAHHYARVKIAVAAAAYGQFASGGTTIPDDRDLGRVEKFVRGWADLGYTSCIAASPAHLECINAILSPSAAEVRAASEVCNVYEISVRLGERASFLNGRVISSSDYRAATWTLTRAGIRK
jgi:citrate lyase beta subunit